MKFDNIIIGGGLSGLLCGIALAREGRHVAAIAAGQSTLHFSSGSFDILGYDADGQVVTSPFEAIKQLEASHPYHLVGLENVPLLATQALRIFTECGLSGQGGVAHNHFRMTPIGSLRPTWFTLDDYLTVQTPQAFPYKKVLLVNVPGFMDFPVSLITEGLHRLGAEVETALVSVPSLMHRRQSPSEMRSANLAKVLARDKKLQQIAARINKAATEVEAVIMPAIVGMDSQEAVAFIRSRVQKPLHFVSTLPPSVPGVRVQTLLRKHFANLGGVYMLGNTVTGGHVEDGRLRYVETSLLPDERLEADDFVLATGSFASDGLKSNYERVFEPIFDLDTTAPADRMQWVTSSVFDDQPYRSYGVKVNASMQAQKGRQTISNLYVAGAVLGGHNAAKLADGAGVDMVTALRVAQYILEKQGRRVL